MIYTFLIWILTLNFSQLNDDRLTVAAAANTQFVMKELVASFEERHSVKVDLILGSSGKLTTQIANGAPFDIFLAADMDYPNYLYQNGLTNHQPRVYASGIAVLWTTNNTRLKDIHSLKSSEIRRIAIANPKTAPYGKLSMEILKSYHYSDLLKDKLVFGESISQVNQYVTLKVVDVGITSKSVVLSPELNKVGNWIELPNAQIEQGVVVINQVSEKKQELAMKFYEFLQSSTAKALFSKYGYICKP